MTLSVGDAIPSFTIEASPQAMKAWAPILRDPNPIHLDPAVVKAKGLGDRVINQGPINVAYIINALAAAFPGAALRFLDTRFLDNVYGGETVEAGGAVTAIEATDGGRLIHCDVWLKARERGAVLSGKAVLFDSTTKQPAPSGANKGV